MLSPDLLWNAHEVGRRQEADPGATCNKETSFLWDLGKDGDVSNAEQGTSTRHYVVGPTEIQSVRVTELVRCKSFQEMHQSPRLPPWAASWTHNLDSKVVKRTSCSSLRFPLVDLELVHCISTAGPTGYCGAAQRDGVLSKSLKRSPRKGEGSGMNLIQDAVT
jgi:hypothetical protein